MDFTFAWERASSPQGPWRHLHVVSFRGTEALATLYRYEITALMREPAPEIDPDELIGQRGTLRIATLTAPAYRVVHGVIIGAEELGPVPGGMLYHIVLAPPLVRAAHRSRCRIFLEKTTRQIIDAVLQGDPEITLANGVTGILDDGDETRYIPAKEMYTWRIVDASRIDDVAARDYCVQYNESDLAFIRRLLEEEGISFHFENSDGICLLVLSDKDSGRTRVNPFDALGPGIAGRAIQSMKLGARLRPRKVSLLDYNWKRPTLDMAVAEPVRPSGSDLFAHEYPGRYTEAPEMGKVLAATALDRLEVEASYAVCESTCRVLAAGNIFAVEHSQSRYDGEYLATKLEIRGEQAGVLSPAAAGTIPFSGVPYAVAMECARRGKNGTLSESRFRPARSTAKPRIHGSQTAFVTAEPSTQGAEIHVGGPPGAEIGCVRVKFHWDTDATRHAKEPTSCWVRVNQVFAGIGEGAVFHPRVGVEVIVDFEEGDPDRPIIVGRVYNGKNRPPSGAPTVSTFKTMSSPATGAFNELTFDDTAGKEQIKLHTPYDWSSDAGHDRTERVGNNSSSSVSVDRSETTGANRSTFVASNNSEVIGANESVTVGADQNVMVGSNHRMSVGANQTIDIGGDQRESVTGSRTISVTASDKLSVAGAQDIQVNGAQTITSAASQTMEAPAQSFNAGNTQSLQSNTLQVAARSTFVMEAGADGKVLAGGNLELIAAAEGLIQAASITANAQGEIVLSAGGSSIKISGAGVVINGATIKAAGGSVDITGAIVKVN
ncbi:MAG: type VI secretion system tip protein VgrG [Polyangiaceae bacterium]|nr:type VI secretion system tip protein VgrG [Polyangiaceae bacterium]